MDQDKQTELCQVPAHLGVDRSDVLNDFKQVRGAFVSLAVPSKKIICLNDVFN